MSTKKIVHVITGLGDGGAEGVLYRLCCNSNSFEHVIISLIDEGKYGQLLRQKGFTVYSLQINSLITLFYAFFRLIKLLYKEKPYAVQTWMYHADLFGGIAAKFMLIKQVFWGVRHSCLSPDKTKKSTLLVAKLCSLLSPFIPNKIICCGNIALAAHKDFGYSSNKMTVIHNGYDLSLFYPNQESRDKTRQFYNIPSDCFLIGKVGRFDPLKDHSNLLKALAIFKNECNNFKCLLIGKGIDTYNSELMEQISKLSLLDNVVLGGQSNNIPFIMNALDLHVLASLSEGFPNVLAEAMACGVYCITTDVGDAKEIISDDSLVCPPADSALLSGLILKSYLSWQNDRDEWNCKRLSFHKRILKNYSISAMVEKYETQWLG